MASEILQAENLNPNNIAAIDTVNVTVNAGDNTVTAKNAVDFTTNDFFRIGDGETAEIKQVNGVAGQVITINGTFSFKHNRFEELIKLRGDKIQFLRAADLGTNYPPPDVNFTQFALVSIDASSFITEAIDASGGSGYWYKYVYYDSFTLSTTNIADAVAVRGGDYGHLCTIPDVRLASGFVRNYKVTDAMLSDARDMAESEVKSALFGAGYILPMVDGQSNPFTPPVVRNVAKILAGGYALLDQYMITGQTNNKDATNKITMGQKLLANITGENYTLIDGAGKALAKTSKINGWPDSTTADADIDSNGGDTNFPMLKKY